MSEFQWNNFIAVYSHKQNDNTDDKEIQRIQ